ncbi:MAG: DUF2851 family protein, partial [Chitinophagia bacterium]|nr:DUF2851 family protein [Chitinophagia bacterium]
TEKLLQFLWQHTLYRSTNLKLSTGEPVTVIHPGQLNTHSGPDFTDSRIKIGATTWAGNVELHLKTSDWNKHGHQEDAAYQNIILHVVLEHDAPENTSFPLLALKGHIPEGVGEAYNKLMQQANGLPCAYGIDSIKPIVKENWLARLLAERWEQKLGDWKVLLDNSVDDWRNLFYVRLAANFGFKTNSTAFLLMAQSLPQNILGRHRANLEQVEALLFGQAGMLNSDPIDDYTESLQQEYHFLRKKYALTPIPAHLWKFLRMRPANFPTVRIAQFAQLIHRSEHLFSKIIDSKSAGDIEALFHVTASSYWDTHFRFGEVHSPSYPKSLGKDSIINIIINTVAPIQFLYSLRQGAAAGREQSLELLNSIPAEKNSIITLWNQHNWIAQNAAESQALIQLHNNYCINHRCLDCAIGAALVRKENK